MALQSLGLSLQAYAAYRVAFDVALALTSLVMGLLIFWRRPDDWLALWVSLLLVLLGTNSVSPFVQTLASVWPNAAWVSLGGGFLGMTSNVYLCWLPLSSTRFLQPDDLYGRRVVILRACAFVVERPSIGQE
jgi:hypothetical protein